MEESSGLLIALSAGGSEEELASRGIGLECVESLMVQVAEKLLDDGHQLAFGGTLGVPDQSLTQSLIKAASHWCGTDPAEMIVSHPSTWPLVNYSAWPFYKSILDDQRSELNGLCNFVGVNPPGVSQDELTAAIDAWPDNPQARLFAADALTAMRDESAMDADMRIVWGGRIAGSMGWMARILEEVMLSLRHEKPVLIFGGFGGSAGVLADYLIDKDAVWPDQLSLQACADADRDRLLTADQASALVARFSEGRELIEEYRNAIHESDNIEGVSCDLIKQALAEATAARAVELSAAAANQRCADLS